MHPSEKNQLKALGLVVLLFACVMAYGCENKPPAECFLKRGEAKIMTDEEGNRYTVTYYGCPYYAIFPLKDVKK